MHTAAVTRHQCRRLQTTRVEPSTTRNDTVNKFVGEPKSPPPGIVRTAALGHGRSGPREGNDPGSAFGPRC